MGGERVREDLGADAWYVRPALVRMPRQSAVMERETFAPILYVVRYEGDTDEAIALQNAVPQGLSSAIFTASLGDAERFMSAAGSDCGIANVNIGTSGAEIGEPSAARRRPAAGANPARMPGRATCAASPTPSTTAARCRSRRACASTSERAAGGVSKEIPTLRPSSLRWQLSFESARGYSTSLAKSAGRERSPRASRMWPLWGQPLKRSTA